jgi:isoaspartyl peptidase/L-asparaginase-like protein (Ntn-hydrolase superfamily)
MLATAMNPLRRVTPPLAVAAILLFAGLAAGGAIAGTASGTVTARVRAVPAGRLARAAGDLVTLDGGPRSGLLVVTHGGAGSPPSLADGPRAAADTGLSVLRAGGSGLDASLAGTVRLENDPRFNAGTGANIRLDGKTVQMDASIMTDDGRFAAVAAIERVRNPVLVARAVMDSTPHILLVGEGATRFAHRIGFEDVVPLSPDAETKYQARMKRQAELFGRTDTTVFDWRRFWNFPGPLPADVLEWGRHGDTVGSVSRDRHGHFAASLSTGGTAVTLCGRVGDVPVFGAGLFAGPAGAVACTGEGELIVKHTVARSVYEMMARGVPARRAVEAAVADFPAEFDLGVIAIDRLGWGVAANRPMAYGVAGE